MNWRICILVCYVPNLPDTYFLPQTHTYFPALWDTCSELSISTVIRLFRSFLKDLLTSTQAQLFDENITTTWEYHRICSPTKRWSFLSLTAPSTVAPFLSKLCTPTLCPTILSYQPLLSFLWRICYNMRILFSPLPVDSLSPSGI